MWTKIDFNRLSQLLLPTFLRKPIMTALLKALVAPLTHLHGRFITKRDEDLYTLAHNGQVFYLRNALNDAFDVDKRRIVLTDGDRFERQYIYTRAEQKPKFLGKIFLRSRGDYKDTGVDFIVKVPRELLKKHFAIKALVNTYKIDVKRYKLIAL